jgi:hypothetical protein
MCCPHITSQSTQQCSHNFLPASANWKRAASTRGCILCCPHITSQSTQQCSHNFLPASANWKRAASTRGCILCCPWPWAPAPAPPPAAVAAGPSPAPEGSLVAEKPGGGSPGGPRLVSEVEGRTVAAAAAAPPTEATCGQRSSHGPHESSQQTSVGEEGVEASGHQLKPDRTDEWASAWQQRYQYNPHQCMVPIPR